MRERVATDDVLRDIGDPRETFEELHRLRRGAAVLSSRQHRLMRRYPRQWVAVYDGKVRAHAKSLDSVIDRLEQEHLPVANVIIRFIDENQVTMIL